MLQTIKNQKSILEKLGIKSLKPMQEEAIAAYNNKHDVVILSPTGTGKTLAFLLPIIENLDVACNEIQALIVVPSRELAIQIEQVVREMGTGYKANAVYGGRAGSEDKIDLRHKPAILIGTPGRIADHLRKESFSSENIFALVLDEFDKSLEIGFETEMYEILKALPKLKKKILTSATQKVEIPSFVGLKNPTTLNYLSASSTKLKIKTLQTNTENKLDALVESLCHIGNKPGIIFCNFKDSIEDVSNYLNRKNITHGCFYGGLEQHDRELSLVKFRNGTYNLLVATDLAARGIDVPEIKFILHYELPPKPDEFTHRNGRTARMNSDGTAYVLKWEGERVPDFISGNEIEKVQKTKALSPSNWETLYITGGRRDKISKGDIAGLFFKQGKLNKDQVGNIELKQDCSYVAIKSSEVNRVLPLVNNSKLKTKKVRVSVI